MHAQECQRGEDLRVVSGLFDAAAAVGTQRERKKEVSSATLNDRVAKVYRPLAGRTSG